MSEAAGLPTGAVIERGANAGGDYVRFADGTQICQSPALASGPVGTALGAGFQSAANTWTFPANFAAGTSPGVTGQCGGSGAWVSLATATATDAGYRALAFVSDPTGYDLRLIAVGRWF